MYKIISQENGHGIIGVDGDVIMTRPTRKEAETVVSELKREYSHLVAGFDLEGAVEEAKNLFIMDQKTHQQISNRKKVWCRKMGIFDEIMVYKPLKKKPYSHTEYQKKMDALAVALETDFHPEEISPNRAFYLGTLTINRKRRCAIFTGNSEDMETSIEAGQFNPYPNPFFLVADRLLSPRVFKQGRVISLRQVLMLSKGRLSVDMDTLKLALSTKKETRLDVIPFSVPTGTEWKHVFISFVNEHTVQIRVGKLSEHRSFDEMGFSDARKNGELPIELWGIFRMFAQMQGEVSWGESQAAFSNPERVKKYVSEIRKKMKALFPNIKGDPFFAYRKVKSYKPRFTLNFLPSAM